LRNKTDKPFPYCLYECFLEFAGKVSDLDYSTVVLEHQGIFKVEVVYAALIQYLQIPIDKALQSEEMIIQAFALLDKRVGKRKLKGMRWTSNIHSLIADFYRFRCDAEQIPLLNEERM
jgi:hypothetical protein